MIYCPFLGFPPSVHVPFWIIICYVLMCLKLEARPQRILMTLLLCETVPRRPGGLWGNNNTQATLSDGGACGMDHKKEHGHFSLWIFPPILSISSSCCCLWMWPWVFVFHRKLTNYLRMHHDWARKKRSLAKMSLNIKQTFCWPSKFPIWAGWPVRQKEGVNFSGKPRSGWRH